MQPGELPAGWTPTPYRASPGDAAEQAALVRCVGGRNTSGDTTSEAHSPDYRNGNAQVSSNAKSVRSQADLKADIALARSPKVDACYQQLLRKKLASSLPTGGTVKSVTVKVTKAAAGSPRNVIATVAATIKVVVSGSPIVLYVNSAMITGKQIEAEVDFTSVGAPLPATLRAGLTKKVADRAARA
ncbi:MAG: hypothetical protein M3070_12600 [Actinomycetota bacterium]|nr:hypothetical protein [Actinomycetota bacterium]